MVKRFRNTPRHGSVYQTITAPPVLLSRQQKRKGNVFFAVLEDDLQDLNLDQTDNGIIVQLRQPAIPFCYCIVSINNKHQQRPTVKIQAHSSTSNSTATAGLQQVPQLVPVSPGGGGKATPPSKMKKTIADKDSEEYRQRRERNNLAVKKSRMRSKQKALDTQQRVNELKEENERLEAKIKLLSKELSVLKDLFLEHAHNLADNVQPPTAAVTAGDLCNNNNSGSNNGSQ
ncbi:hypothetical protein AOLI_G00286420 [Acnodon oligacanthus]